MDRQDIALTFLSTSVVLGLALGIMVNPGILRGFIDVQQNEVHEHAMFFVHANGSQIDLRKDRFQLQSQAVHLENNKSSIVHKHKRGVTWGRFLETLDIQVNTSGEEKCLEMPKETFCGNMTLMVNGEEYDPNKEIQQGDNFAIVVGNNTNSKAEAYMNLELPEAYRKGRYTTRV